MSGAQQQPGEAGKRRGENRPDASMSLLLRLMANPLDADYAEAAQRRRQGEGPVTRAPRVTLVALLMCVGLFVSVAVAQAREQPITNDQRERLIGEINERTAATDRLQQQLLSLREEIGEMRGDRLAHSERGQQARERLERLQVAAGVVPVQGPGLTVTLDDPSPAGDAASSGTGRPPGRVLDRDLQLLVDALWTAGAEAIAVDGQRVTSLTAIRSAGQAILINYRPINPPYEVAAIGDPEQLRGRLADSEAGRRFHTLSANLGIRFTTAEKSRLRLPGASGLSLSYATEVGQE